MKFKSIIMLMFVLIIGLNAYGQKSNREQSQRIVPNISAEHMNAQHREILQYWLANKPGWRPAVENDAYVGQTKEGREYYKGEILSMRNHPFYVAADLNKDGKQDFAEGIKLALS